VIKNLTRCGLPALALAALPLLATAGPAGADSSVPGQELPFTSYAPAQLPGGAPEIMGTGPVHAAEDPHPELGRTVLLQRLLPNGEGGMRRCLKSGAAWGEYSGYAKCDSNDKSQQFQFEKNAHGSENPTYRKYPYQLRNVGNNLCLAWNPNNDPDTAARPLDCNKVHSGLRFEKGVNNGWVLHAAQARRDRCLDSGNPVMRGHWNTCNSGNYQSWIPVPVSFFSGDAPG
jgi:hypothetical protein